jgi:hypothetical protein
MRMRVPRYSYKLSQSQHYMEVSGQKGHPDIHCTEVSVGSQNHSGHCGKQKTSLTVPGIQPLVLDCPETLLTKLPTY